MKADRKRTESGHARVILAGCVAAKQRHAAPARDLYVSPLWRKRRDYAERCVHRGEAIAWAIISAKHGLVQPLEVLEPYDKRLGPRDVKPMAARLAEQLFEWFDSDVEIVEIHAGAYYVQTVRATGLAVEIEHPIAGLGIGEQQHWYDEQARDAGDDVGQLEIGG